MKLSRKRRRHYSNSRPQVLVLNKAWRAINILDYEEAIGDWANGRADIINTYDHFRIRSGYDSQGERTVDMNCPSVIVMVDSKPSDFHIQKVDFLPLTRRNIYERDKGRCAYCDRDIGFNEFTVDHVYPLSRGGLNDWFNVRASCYSCNNEKDDYTLSELNWKLKRRVGIPTLTKSAPKSIIYHLRGKIPHESWRPYIYWEVKTKEKVRDDVEPVERNDKLLKKWGRRDRKGQPIY